MPAAAISKGDLLVRLAEGHAARIAVVTPNARLARELAQEFDEGQVAKDLKVWETADILPLSALRERLSRGVRIRLKATCPRETIEALWEVMTRHRGDRPVAVEVEMNGGSRHVIVRADVTPSIRVRTSEQFVADVERLCGPGSVTIHS